MEYSNKTIATIIVLALFLMSVLLIANTPITGLDNPNKIESVIIKIKTKITELFETKSKVGNDFGKTEFSSRAEELEYAKEYLHVCLPGIIKSENPEIRDSFTDDEIRNWDDVKKLEVLLVKEMDLLGITFPTFKEQVKTLVHLYIKKNVAKTYDNNPTPIYKKYDFSNENNNDTNIEPEQALDSVAEIGVDSN